MELDEETFRVRLEEAKKPSKSPPPPFAQPMKFDYRVDEAYKNGLAQGVRIALVGEEARLPTLVYFVLDVEGIKIEVGFYTKKRGGLDFSAIELMLGTLRRK
jgi:hypothetical protein